jgi:2-(1,2-epoxy-1,2-dihydrophenyl)acetyl-CoA isomerase
MRRIGAVALALLNLTKPTIAKVRGVAAGAGCNMALACDLVVASDAARFTQIFAKRGMVVDFGGSWLLPRLVGMQRAKELAFFGDFVSADEARDIGLVNRVLPDAELDAFTDEWAARLAAGPPLALSMTKAMLGRSFETSIEQALEDEARCQAVCIGSKDTREAIKAFVEKRPPVFRGR